MVVEHSGVPSMQDRTDTLDRMSRCDTDLDSKLAPSFQLRIGRERSIRIRSVAMAPTRMLNGYLRGFAAEFRQTPAYFKWIDGTYLRQSDATLVVVTEHDRAVSGAFYTMNNLQTAIFQGLWTMPSFRGQGLAPLGIAMAVLAENQLRHSLVGGEAYVRVMPDGACNEPSRRCFEKRLGFHEAAVLTKAICGNAQDRHLAASAEPGGKTFRAMRMIAQPDVLARQARMTIKEALATQMRRAA